MAGIQGRCIGLDRGWDRGAVVGTMVVYFLANGGQPGSGIDRFAVASLFAGRECAGIAGGGADAHRGAAEAGMLRGNRHGNGNLRGSGGDAAEFWAEHWVFVLPKMEAGEGEIASICDLTVNW